MAIRPTVIERDHYVESLLDKIRQLEEKVRQLEAKVTELAASS